MALEAWFRAEPSQLVRIKMGLRQNGRRDSAIPVRPRRQRRSDTAREEGEDHSVQAQLSFFSFSSSSRHLTRASNLPFFSAEPPLELLHRSQAVLSVIHRLDPVHIQQFR